MSQASSSSQNASQGPSDAAAPFDNAKRTADAILRSNDGVNFYVHQRILVEASSVFEQTFSQGSPVDVKKRKRGKDTSLSYTTDGTVVLEVPASSYVLPYFLLHLYPTRQPRVPAKVTGDIRRLAILYNIQFIQDLMEDPFAKLANRDPVFAYVMAIKDTWEEGARIAARASLTKPVITEAPRFMDDISTVHLRVLQRYHRNCVDAALAAASLWAPKDDYRRQHDQTDESLCWFKCGYVHGKASTQATSKKVPKWYARAMQGLLDVLRASPCKEKIQDRGLLRKLTKFDCCDGCMENVAWDFLQVVESIGDAVEGAVSKVVLEYQASKSATA